MGLSGYRCRFDHIAGSQPFEDLGATFVAQRNAEERIQALKPADVVVADQAVDERARREGP